MKPIKLKIKGLNSFIEEQVIDFRKLTAAGLFGIFGPTGSGKSTILDGITLALYGEVSRKSTNYINTNCNSLNVSFEFQISGVQVLTYIVSREFQRDKNTSNPRSGKCKIVKITNGIEEVLADKVREVSDKCTEIIGLSLDDFTRTVVLPQGKFSDFLKLEGKSRRDMLERLFNLQEYGDNLGRKLGVKTLNARNASNILQGELNGFEDISEDKLKAKKEDLKSIQKLFKNNYNEYKNIEKAYIESTEVLKLNLELKGYIIEEQKLENIKNEVNDKKQKIDLGESALKLIPSISAFEDTSRHLLIAKKEEEILHDALFKIKEEMAKIEQDWNKASEKKDNKLPDIKIQEQKVQDAISEKKLLEELESGNNEILKLKNKLDNEKKVKEQSLDLIIKEINSKKVMIINLEKKSETLKVSDFIKENVQKGMLLNEKFKNIKKQLEVINEKKDKLSKELKLNKEEEIVITKKWNDNLKALSILTSNFDILKSNAPGEQRDLLDLQNKLLEVKEKTKKYNELSKEIYEIQKNILKQRRNLDNITNEKNKLEEALNDLKNDFNTKQNEIIASKLRLSLELNSICPVCGSTEHEPQNIKIEEIDFEKTNQMEEEIIKKESELKKYEEKIIILNTNIKNEKAKEVIINNDIFNLGEDFKKISVEDLDKGFNELLNAMDKYKKDKEYLEINEAKLKEECHKIEALHTRYKTIIQEGNKQIDLVIVEKQKNINEYDILNNQINLLKSEIEVDDFNKKNIEIKQIESECDKSRVELTSIRESLEIDNKGKESLQEEINVLKQRLIKGESIHLEKEKYIEEKRMLILSKVGEEKDLNHLLAKIQEELIYIINNFNSIDKAKVQIEKKFHDKNDMLLSIKGQVQELIIRQNQLNIKISDDLKEEGFISIEEVQNNNIGKEKITILKEFIEDYNNKLSKVKGAVESLKIKLNGKEILEADYIKLEQEKSMQEEKVNLLNKEKIKLEEEIILIAAKFEKLKSLLLKKEELEHKLALLNDLDKLFKGKKFVEYVAITRLKYITNEATKRLFEITNGNYGIEVDENGKFLIRDYKNGGFSRDASTLSGGETFLASLCLALSLSSEIQLKGIAPLELFFLDEGFGTLDDELLEVVMNSLEKIHNDKLKVGIISHVESIKNRVPIKLIITPAESGMGGSKALIERS